MKTCATLAAVLLGGGFALNVQAADTPYGSLESLDPRFGQRLAGPEHDPACRADLDGRRGSVGDRHQAMPARHGCRRPIAVHSELRAPDLDLAIARDHHEPLTRSATRKLDIDRAIDHELDHRFVEPAQLERR